MEKCEEWNVQGGGACKGGSEDICAVANPLPELNEHDSQ